MSAPDAKPDGGAGNVCPGKVVPLEADCPSPCEVFTHLESSKDVYWCSSPCSKDDDCAPGLICTKGQWSCDKPCGSIPECQAAGMEDCLASGGDPRKTCF